MAKIMENVVALRDAVLKEVANPTPGSTLVSDLRSAAIRATLGGIASGDWTNYMTIFADNENQLQRLRAEDSFASITYIRESAAYLVGGAICTDLTMSHLADRIDATIDDGLDPTPDGKIQKLIEIPKPAPPANPPASPPGNPPNT